MFVAKFMIESLVIIFVIIAIGQAIYAAGPGKKHKK